MMTKSGYRFSEKIMLHQYRVLTVTWEASKLLEQRVAAGDLDLARRFLDVELLHHAVLDQHGVALGARAEAVARAVEGEVDRLGELAVAVGQELELVGGGGLLPG